MSKGGKRAAFRSRMNVDDMTRELHEKEQVELEAYWADKCGRPFQRDGFRCRCVKPAGHYPTPCLSLGGRLAR